MANGYSAERAQLSKVRLKLSLRVTKIELKNPPALYHRDYNVQFLGRGGAQICMQDLF
jgi:hypothetical protein